MQKVNLNNYISVNWQECKTLLKDLRKVHEKYSKTNRDLEAHLNGEFLANWEKFLFQVGGAVVSIVLYFVFLPINLYLSLTMFIVSLLFVLTIIGTFFLKVLKEINTEFEEEFEDYDKELKGKYSYFTQLAHLLQSCHKISEKDEDSYLDKYIDGIDMIMEATEYLEIEQGEILLPKKKIKTRTNGSINLFFYNQTTELKGINMQKEDYGWRKTILAIEVVDTKR